jgi:hypothetical protein
MERLAILRHKYGLLHIGKRRAKAIEHLYAIDNVEMVSRHTNLMRPLSVWFPVDGLFRQNRRRNAIQSDKFF